MLPALFFCKAGFLYAKQPDAVYFSDNIKHVNISSTQQMLLIFPEAPFGRSCQNKEEISNKKKKFNKNNDDKLVDIKPPDENSSFSGLGDNSAYLANSTKNLYNGLPNKFDNMQNDLVKELLSKRLILTPLKKSGTAVCTFELADQESFTIAFHLMSDVVKPAIEFKNLYQNKKEATQISQSIGGLGVFKILLTGQEISFFSNVTPYDKELLNDLANYKIDYIGTDKNSYKAWRITARLKKNIEDKIVLKPKNLGDLFYSAVSKNDSTYDDKYLANEKIKIFILSRPDLELSELKEILP